MANGKTKFKIKVPKKTHSGFTIEFEFYLAGDVQKQKGALNFAMGTSTTQVIGAIAKHVKAFESSVSGIMPDFSSYKDKDIDLDDVLGTSEA
uniref:Uncharacterized protein n=1 Tax=viral metagenome TaxID=1070528 RepID=A0A6H1ZVS6_9ZZZZ